MNNKLKVISIANCGLLISTPNTTILVDGIFAETEYFQGWSPSMKLLLQEGKSPFQRVDYLLFTHNHPDHLDYHQLIPFIETTPLVGVFLPSDSTSFYQQVTRILKEKGTPLLSPDFDLTARGQWAMGDCQLTYFFSPHSGKEYQDVNHFALLISTPYGRIYVSGDSDFSRETQVEALQGIPVDVAFFNPYHLNSPSGRRIIAGVQAEDTWIYHIPSEDKDHFSIRKQALRDVEKHRERLPPTRLILDRGLDLSEELKREKGDQL